jgi:hypothetical protein
MKKISILTCTMIALTSFMAITVWAVSPHFISCGASGVNSDGSLNACFKIAGLGTNQSITVTATADASAVYACRNHGQQCPDAANKSTVTGTVSASGMFTSGKNGQVTACLALDPPPNTSLTCPPGQRLVLVSVNYTNVKISSAAVGDCTSAPSTFSQNFFPNCP